MAYDKLTIG